jgi:hypothetical protein
MKHRDIQPAHEKAVLDSFTAHLEKQGVELTVVDRPDPPDAIVNINGVASWIEITDAFQSSDWAQSITSYAADDKDHKPYTRRLIHEPDLEACKKVQEVILKKVNKNTMKVLSKTKGLGILLVGAYTPLTSPQEIIEQAGNEICAAINEEDPIFSAVYLYRHSEQGHVFYKLC